MEVTNDQLAVITEAASKAQLTVAEWALLVLEQAAQLVIASSSRVHEAKVTSAAGLDDIQ
jgi:hypothetical protein